MKCSISDSFPFFEICNSKISEEEEELQRRRANAGVVSAIMARLEQSLKGVSWSFVLISAPLVIWIFSLDSDITNIFWE